MSTPYSLTTSLNGSLFHRVSRQEDSVGAVLGVSHHRGRDASPTRRILQECKDVRSFSHPCPQDFLGLPGLIAQNDQLLRDSISVVHVLVSS